MFSPFAIVLYVLVLVGIGVLMKRPYSRHSFLRKTKNALGDARSEVPLRKTARQSAERGTVCRDLRQIEIGLDRLGQRPIQ